MDKKYLIDTNIFITAHRETYPFDIFPSFWEEFLKKAAPKSIIIDQVDKEIKGNDALSIWYKNNKHIFIFSSIPDVLVVDAYRK